MGRTALVTGGGSGIGRGIALGLARRGIAVALVGRRSGPLAEVAREVAACGAQAVALCADLTVGAQRADVVPRVRAALGPLDIVVNNAGALAGGALARQSADAVQGAIALNLTAPIELTRLALDDLVARRGVVALVGSGASHVPLPSASVYSATKAGLRAFGAALRYELEPLGVRVLVSYPAATDTAMVAGMARGAGMRRYPLADPLVVGERIALAIVTRRRELYLGMGEHAFALAYRYIPGVVRAALWTQRERFARMISAAGPQGEVSR